MTSETGLQQFKIIFTPDDTEISRFGGGQYKAVHDGRTLDCGRYQDESLDYRSVGEILERFVSFFAGELKLAVEEHNALAATAAAAADSGIIAPGPFDDDDYDFRYSPSPEQLSPCS